MIRRPPRSTQSRSSAASDVYKRQVHGISTNRRQGSKYLISPTSFKFTNVYAIRELSLNNFNNTFIFFSFNQVNDYLGIIWPIVHFPFLNYFLVLYKFFYGSYYFSFIQREF
eukprot:TRINITY_DN2541_c0_g1_i19.p2 TRINITY_DN2541_c0_g1~~TRINITY_DN2541_c0_g1_i19.p2  ORF type:complete len:112 (+),score=31.93 TRINITY_DN2541_c0_g1_i19:28-363(+)